MSACSPVVAVVGVVLAAAAVAGQSGPAHAGAWLLAPTASFNAGTDSNPRLVEDPARSETGARLRLGARLSGGTERLDLDFVPEAYIVRSRSDQSLDQDNFYLASGAAWRNERSLWSAAANWALDNTRLSELGTTGLVQEDYRREYVSISAGPSWSVTETHSAGARLQWAKTRYPNSGSSRLVGYTDSSASVFSSWEVSERGGLSLTAQGSLLETDGLRDPTRNGVLSLGFDYVLGPRWRFELSGGPAWAASGESTRSGYLFSAEASRRGERTSLGIGAGRRLTPIGTGYLAVVDEIYLSATREWSERVSLSLAARGSRNRTLFDEAAGAETETRYYGIDGSLRWRVAEDWSVVFDLGHRVQQLLPSQASEAKGYRAALGISWTGRTLNL